MYFDSFGLWNLFVIFYHSVHAVTKMGYSERFLLVLQFVLNKKSNNTLSSLNCIFLSSDLQLFKWMIIRFLQSIANITGLMSHCIKV